MSNAQKVVDHLSEAARLLSFPAKNFEGDKNGFSNIIEQLVERSRCDPNADMICSMLYAAREAVEMKR